MWAQGKDTYEDSHRFTVACSEVMLQGKPHGRGSESPAPLGAPGCPRRSLRQARARRRHDVSVDVKHATVRAHQDVTITDGTITTVLPTAAAAASAATIVDGSG